MPAENLRDRLSLGSPVALGGHPLIELSRELGLQFGETRVFDQIVEAMRIVEEELVAYGEGLEDKPRLVALNKLDLADKELGDAA